MPSSRDCIIPAISGAVIAVVGVYLYKKFSSSAVITSQSGQTEDETSLSNSGTQQTVDDANFTASNMTTQTDKEKCMVSDQPRYMSFSDINSQSGPIEDATNLNKSDTQRTASNMTTQTDIETDMVPDTPTYISNEVIVSNAQGIHNNKNEAENIDTTSREVILVDNIDPVGQGNPSACRQSLSFADNLTTGENETEILDAILLHADEDADYANKFITHMDEEFKDLNVKIVTYGQQFTGKSYLDSTEKLFENCIYFFVLVTYNFEEAKLQRYINEIALIKTITEDERLRNRLIPIKTGDFNFAILSPLIPLNYKNFLENKTVSSFKQSFRNLIIQGRKKFFKL